MAVTNKNQDDDLEQDDDHDQDHDQDPSADAAVSVSGSSDPATLKEERRRIALERNRLAAIRARQKKREHIASLEQLIEQLQDENKHLRSQVQTLEKRLDALSSSTLQQ
eukprot:jgi/Hompol1/6959/HPOL_001013-RA